MSLVNLPSFSGITDNAPASPSYLNSKFSQLVSMVTAVNSSGTDFGITQSGQTYTAPPTTGWVLKSVDSGGQGLNVAAFGVVGDGTTDDTAALQAAFNAVPVAADAASLYATRGQAVILPAGVYRVTSGLTLQRGTTLIGSGSESCIFISEITSGDILSYTRPNVAMSNEPCLTLKGFKVITKDGVSHTSGAGVRLDSSDTVTSGKANRVLLEDVAVFYCYEGIRIRNALGGTLRFCQARYNHTSGFIFRGFSTLLNVQNCWASANSWHGWDISGWAYCGATACGSDSNYSDGWHVEKQSGDGTMYANTFTAIGSEGNRGNLSLFSGLNQTSIQGFLGIPPAGVANEDGMKITAVTGFWVGGLNISTSTLATGYGLRVTDPYTSLGIVLASPHVATYGTSAFTGLDNVTMLGYETGNRTAMGGAIDPAQVPSWPLQVVNRTNAVGTASRILSDFRSIATDNKGSAIWRLGADNGTSFAELHHNSLVGAPYTFGTFGDALLHATAGRVQVMSSNATVSQYSVGYIRDWVPSYATSGLATLPSVAFSSESSLGLYRSGVSTLAPSYGTFNLATNNVRLSIRTVAADSLNSTTLAVDEVAFSVGGASGASLAIRSGGTIWYFASSASTKG